MTSALQLIQRLWSLCQYLRDTGIGAHDYLEQMVFLLFLKMAQERQLSGLDNAWTQLLAADDEALCSFYEHLLDELGQLPGIAGTVFQQAESRVDRAPVLRHFLREIDQMYWSGLDLDVMASAYEGILQKAAEDKKSGTGQYFTPRALIEAIVEVMRPSPGLHIADPACGTGGFLLAAHAYLTAHYPFQCTSPQAKFFGSEIVSATARICVMNLLLHGICAPNDLVSPIVVTDSLRAPTDRTFDMILSNPPFGRDRGGKKVGGIERSDFWVVSSNKQLNFLQHIASQLRIEGEAAVVIPDNVLFARGEGEHIRRQLLQVCDVHTLLRLPTGLFYAHGVKANVLFFKMKPPRSEPWTSRLWIYDLRTNHHFTQTVRQISRADLDDFVRSYSP